MRMTGLCILCALLFLAGVVSGASEVRTGSDGRHPYTAVERTVGHITAARVRAVQERAAALDRLGRTEQATQLRTRIATWKAEEKILPAEREPVRLESVPGRPLAERSSRGSMICTSPWAEDILIYQGVYAWDVWLYGNSFAVDYDSLGNLFAAVGLPDSTIHLFYSDDQGATWTDEMTVTPIPKEPEPRLDLCVSDDGDSTLLYLVYLYPGDGGNLWSATVDYSTWTFMRDALLDSLPTDSVQDFWVVRDHYYDDDYYLHSAYLKNDGGLYYTASFDHGGSWDIPVRLGDDMGKPCIEWGGYSGFGVLYLAALRNPSSPDASSAWVTNSWDDGGTWGSWENLNVSWDNLDVVIGASHLDQTGQMAHAIVTTNFNNSGDYNIYPRYTTDGGVNWNLQTSISEETDFAEHLPDIDVYRSEDNTAFYCAYYKDDTTTGAFDSLMIVYTDSTDWSANAPGEPVNDSLYMNNIRPQVTFGGGPWVGVAYAGAEETNIYYDNAWFTGVTEEKREHAGGFPGFSMFQCSPNPFRARTNISYSLPERAKTSIRVYNTAGQVVRTLFEGEQNPGIHSVVWDGHDLRGRLVPAGVYIYHLSAHSVSRTGKVILLR